MSWARNAKSLGVAWEMLLLPPSPSLPAGAEGKPHFAALDFNHSRFTRVCDTAQASSLPATRLAWKGLQQFGYRLRQNTNTTFN